MTTKFDKIVKYFKGKLSSLYEKKKSEANGWGYPWSPMGNLPLAFKTISTTATHYNKPDAEYVYIKDYTITEYDGFHNLYGFLEGIATNEYL